MVMELGFFQPPLTTFPQKGASVWIMVMVFSAIFNNISVISGGENHRSAASHWLCFCFVYLRLVYSMLPVSLDCPFLIGNIGLLFILLCVVLYFILTGLEIFNIDSAYHYLHRKCWQKTKIRVQWTNRSLLSRSNVDVKGHYYDKPSQLA